MTKLRFTKTQARETLDRHLNEMGITLAELAEFGMLGYFPTDRHRIIYALAYDLGLTTHNVP